MIISQIGLWSYFAWAESHQIYEFVVGNFSVDSFVYEVPVQIIIPHFIPIERWTSSSTPVEVLTQQILSSAQRDPWWFSHAQPTRQRWWGQQVEQVAQKPRQTLVDQW